MLGPADDAGVKGKVVDGGGRTLLPGLIDAHGHVTELGRDALQLDLVGTTSVADLQQRLRDYAAAHPEAQWILGSWMESGTVDRETLPHRGRSRLCRAGSAGRAGTRRRPCARRQQRGNESCRRHSGDANTAGRPDRERPLRRQRQGAGGEGCSGRRRRKTWMSPSQKAQDILLGFGVTGVGAMSTSLEDWNTYRRAGEAGQLKVRLMAYALNGPLAEVPHPTPLALRRQAAHGRREILRRRSARLARRVAQAALCRQAGHARTPVPFGRGAARDGGPRSLAGFQIATHAIGDAANAQIISVYEQLSRKYGLDRRWRIEHFQIVDPADIPRIAPAGIIASMQPTHQTSDRLMAEKRLGPETAQRRLCVANRC